MRKIKISENRLSDSRLLRFYEWREKLSEEQRTNEKPSELWNKFIKTKIYDGLKDFLSENQGKICCYCGSSLIKPNHADIEHLKPKSSDKALIFNEHNLFIACSVQKEAGEHITIEYQVTEKDTKRFSSDLQRFKHYLCDNYSIEESSIYWCKTGQENNKNEPVSTLTKFPQGKKLLLITDKPKNTCNNAKNNSFIHFDLKDEKLESHFSYNDAGEIIATDASEPFKAEIQKDLDEILNLNCDYLKDRRAERYKAIQLAINELFESSENIAQDLNKLSEGYSTPNEYNELEPYCFVKLHVINDFLLSV